ncbi:MAG: hypothetical protein ABDH31_06730 [Chlorobiota bacterium]
MLAPSVVRLLLIAGLLLCSNHATEAIPAFARQYGLSCATCHHTFPKLNAFGQQFSGSGYIFEGLQEKAYVPGTGDDRLNLFDRVPLGFRFQQWAEVRADGSRVRQDFKAPWGVKFLTGGALGRIASFYAYVIFEKGEAPFFEDAWVHLHPWEGWGLQLGQFQPCDLMFPRELRLTRSDYTIYTVGRFPLTYQRGIILSLPWNFSIGAVNGNGIDEYIGEDADADNRKVFFAHIRLPLELGLFGLYGEMPDTAGTLIRGYRVGLDWRWTPWDYTELFLQLLYGSDNTRAHELAGGFLGVDYTNFPHAVAFLANLVTAPLGSVYRPLRQQSVAVQYSYYPYRNVRILAELERQLLRPVTRLTLGVDFAY